MVLPGRVPGYKSSDIQLLPSSTTKHQVWQLYQQAAGVESLRPVSYATFTSLWRQLLPHVVVMKPMSDLCWMCQKNSTAITRSSNRPEEEKTLVSSQYMYTYKPCKQVFAVNHVKLETNNTNLATPVYKYTPCTHARERNKGEGGEQGMVGREGRGHTVHTHKTE